MHFASVAVSVLRSEITASTRSALPTSRRRLVLAGVYHREKRTGSIRISYLVERAGAWGWGWRRAGERGGGGVSESLKGRVSETEKEGALEEWEGRGFTGVTVALHWQGQIVPVSNRSGPAKERPHSLGLPGRRTRRFLPLCSSQRGNCVGYT